MTRDGGPWIVAGMHRSGTSLVASSLADAGIDLGERLLPADEQNRPGYFEDVDFVDLDRRMLTAACPPLAEGHPDWGWTEGGSLDRLAFEPYRDEARRLVEARASRQVAWGFKDPRATLLLDFWSSLAPAARFVLVYRLPWQVADSMQRLGADVFLRRPEWGYRIWAFYNRHLLDFQRRHPDRSILVSVDAAVRDPRLFANALNERLALRAPPDALVRRFQSALFRLSPEDDPLGPLAGAAHPECRELLAALDAAATLPATNLWRSDAPRARSPTPQPRVSVVIPCHGDGEFLIEAVASVERSVSVPSELIVVDDGSPDSRTRAVLDLLATAGYDVHRRTHAGVAAARNHGFGVARAPFVIPLDADNRLLPGFVEPALEVLPESPRVAAVYGDRVEFGQRRGRVEVGAFDARRMVHRNYVDTCAVIRREAWQECGGYDPCMPLQGWEDWELWLALIERGWALHWLPLPSFEYRVRPDSMLHALESSPDSPRVAERILGKHYDLYLRTLGESLEALRATRHQVDEAKAGLAAAAAALAERDEALGAATATLAERDDAISAATAMLAERDEALSAAAATIAERDEAISAAAATIAGRDDALRVAAATIAERDEALRAATAALAERDEELDARTVSLARRSAALDEARRSLEELGREHQSLAVETRRVGEARTALERQRLRLHALLQLWRESASTLEATRAMRARRAVVRLRSRLEGRGQVGPAFPCVIGGTGGSDTRVFARLAMRGGLSIGDERNEFEDALPIERFLDDWLVPFWQGGGSEPPHCAPPGIDEGLTAALAQQLAGGASITGPRGWKSPRSLYLLPFLAQRFPQLRFLHVLRDGRDVALSQNQLQLGRYGGVLLSPAELELPEAERSIALWSRVNLWAAGVGEGLGPAYLRVRLEDLCARPVAVSRRVLRFFDLPGNARRAAKLVATPDSLGRWRRADSSLVARLEELGGDALRRFGYLSR